MANTASPKRCAILKIVATTKMLRKNLKQEPCPHTVETMGSYGANLIADLVYGPDDPETKWERI